MISFVELLSISLNSKFDIDCFVTFITLPQNIGLPFVLTRQDLFKIWNLSDLPKMLINLTCARSLVFFWTQKSNNPIGLTEISRTPTTTSATMAKRLGGGERDEASSLFLEEIKPRKCFFFTFITSTENNDLPKLEMIELKLYLIQLRKIIVTHTFEVCNGF